MDFKDPVDVERALDKKQLSARTLHEIWQVRQRIPDPAGAAKAGITSGGQNPWMQSGVELCLRFVDRAFEHQEFLLICDAAREMLRFWSGRAEKNSDLLHLRMHLARALTHLGQTQEASDELDQCLKPRSGPAPTRAQRAEMLQQLGALRRQESHDALNRAASVQAVEAALQSYEEAFELLEALPQTDMTALDRLEALTWVAALTINAAREDKARRNLGRGYAKRLLTLAEKLEGSTGPRFAILRAQAEALVLLDREGEARKVYRRLRRTPSATVSALADARYRTAFLADALNKPRKYYYRAFPKLQLVVFSGHMPDRPDRPKDVPIRFPADRIDAVRKLLRRELARINAHIGISSAAAGADLLFLDELGKRENSLFHVVLPWSEQEFRQTSVAPYKPKPDPALWERLFNETMQKAASLRQLGEFYPPSQDSNVGWKYMLEVTAGLALQTARALRLDVQPLVLWDEQPGRGPGGTSDFVEFWEQKLGKKHCVIKMPRAESKSASRYEPGTARRAERRVLRQEVKTMLFADIVGYSKIKEHAIPNFVTGFLDRASQLAAASRHAPQNVSTWGDAIYAVFDFAVDAGNFALELAQLIHANSKEWEQLELYWDERASGDRPAERQPLNIRIGLHTGPVFQHYNPLVRQLGFTGAHVSRAARIEPVTQRGEVFASEEFAALVEMDSAMRRHQAEKKPLASGSSRTNSQGDETDPAAFVCEYVGSMPLAKDYPGLHRIYRLVPTRRFDIEELARVIHDRYCREQRKAGKTAKELPALRPWSELSENMREASREQAADIPYKLRELGYDLTRRGGIDPNQIAPEPERVEEMAKREHVRWMTERQRNGWTYGKKRDDKRRKHPSIVDWNELSESEKDKDRDPIRHLPTLVAKAGLLLRKIG